MTSPGPELVPRPGGGAPDPTDAFLEEARRIGHDLNNCLGVIVGRAELARLHLERGNAEAARTGLETILTQTDRIRQLSDELRSLRRRA